MLQIHLIVLSENMESLLFSKQELNNSFPDTNVGGLHSNIFWRVVNQLSFPEKMVGY